MQIHEPSKSILLRVRDPGKYEQFLHNRQKPINIGQFNLAVRHGLQETIILNNMGVKAPSPILTQYDWPGKYAPWDHQKITAARLTLHRRIHVLNEAGTAKTASALWAADYLMKIGKVRKVLIVAKLSTLECVWMEEVFNVLMHRRAVLVYGSREKRLAALNSDADFYIINHEGIQVVIEELRAAKDHDILILDEASDYRNATTSKYKLFYSLIRKHTRVWPMTATPCPNAPTDAWALARLVDPSKVPVYFGQFKSKTMKQLSTYKWEPKPGSEKMAFDVLQPAVLFKKKDCLDLPPVVRTKRSCVLSKEQSKQFTRMKNEAVLEAKNHKITAVNAADKVNKMRQLMCGVIKDTETGLYLPVDYKPRLDLLLECIAEANAKVIVVVPFKGIIEHLADDIGKHYSCAVLNGDVSFKKRREVINEFKTLTNPHVLACHPKVMAHGLNLTEADTLIFYAPIYSNDEALQVVERFNRAGQTRKMTIVEMGAHPLEWSIYKMLEGKQEGQANILDLYDSIIT